MKTLTLLVTYNEVDNISRLIPEILKYLPSTSVLVVDDNSPDGTAKAVSALAERDKPGLGHLPHQRARLRLGDDRGNAIRRCERLRLPFNPRRGLFS